MMENTSSSPTGPNAPVTPPVRAPRRSVRSYFWWSVLGAFVLLALYTLFLLWWSYSEGERAGVLQKFSKRGWICKTNEGELAMYVVGGIAPQIWDFSVRDDAVAAQLHQAVGRQVRLHYSEHPGLPTNCFGETRYFVDRVEIVAGPGVVAPESGLTVSPGSIQPVDPTAR
jgi:hypothetical protein